MGQFEIKQACPGVNKAKRSTEQLHTCHCSVFLATLVALHFTPVSKSVGHSFELA